MGHQLETAGKMDHAGLYPLWLDAETSALADDMVKTLAQTFPDLLAVVLFGSIARHDERPVDDEYPSDVDLLLIFDTTDEQVAVKLGRVIFPVLGEAQCRHLRAPREVKVMLASRTLREWDPTFVANVARDGILLFAHGPLPEPLAAIEIRAV